MHSHINPAPFSGAQNQDDVSVRISVMLKDFVLRLSAHAQVDGHGRHGDGLQQQR